MTRTICVLRRITALTILGCALLPIFAAPSAVAADDWPCFRGAQHDGISSEQGLQTDWPEPPPRVWEREIGSGFSAFAIIGDKAYTCGTADGQQMLFCMYAKTGEPIWQTPIEAEYRERQGGDGPRGTPTFADGRVYVQGALGRLLCCDAATGKEIWSAQYSAKPRWGYSHSILIEGDLAITQGGGDHGAVVAHDRKTGKKVWEAGGDAPVGYGTPYPFSMDGTRYIAVFLAKKMLVVAAKDGKEACSIDWATDWDVNAAQPIYHDGRLFVSSGYRTGSAVFKLAGATDGGLTADKVWGIDKVILGKFQSACLWEGNLYVADEKALKCVDFATGKELWKQRGFKEGSTVLIAGGHLLAFSAEGELQIARLNPQKFEPTTDKLELLNGRCWTMPVLHDGRLYVRNLQWARCYKLAQ